MIEWLNANQGAVLALLTALYTVATIILVGVSIWNVRTLINLEKERRRPIVLLKFEHLHHHLISVVLTNIGESTAVDVDVGINPIPKRGDTDEPAVSFLHERTTSLPPGAENKALIGELAHVKKQNPDLTYRGSISYSNKGGVKYEEAFRIDLDDQLDGTTIIRRTVHDVAEHLKKIERHVRHLIEGRKSPLLCVQSEDAYQEERWRTPEEIQVRREHLEEIFDLYKDEKDDT